MLNKAWFVGGILTAAIIAVVGLGIASAQVKIADPNEVPTVKSPTGCGCANHNACGNGCAAMKGTGSCGCGK